MKEIFTLNSPRVFWLISAVVALVVTALIYARIDKSPELISIPIVIGTFGVVIGEFWEDITYGISLLFKPKEPATM